MNEELTKLMTKLMTDSYDQGVKDALESIKEGLDALPKREWVDLSDSQIEQVYFDFVKRHRGAAMPWAQIQFGKALQVLIKEKNNG